MSSSQFAPETSAVLKNAPFGSLMPKAHLGFIDDDLCDFER